MHQHLGQEASRPVNSITFRTEKEHILNVLLSWDQVQLQEGIEYLLNHVDAPTLSALAANLQKRLQRDIVSQMPHEVAVHIFSLLDYHSLLSARAVNRRWWQISHDDRLWKMHWQRKGWTTLREEEQLLAEGKVTYASLFINRLEIERNWLKGDYYVHALLAHTDGITALHFKDDRLVSASHDRSIKVWNLRTGQVICTIIGHTNAISCVKMHEDTVVSGSWDGTVRVWRYDAARFECVHTFNEQHGSAVLSLAFNGGRCCVTGSFDNKIRIFDIRQGRLMRTLRGHTNSVLAVQFDSNIIVSGSEDNTVRIWSVREARSTHVLEGHEAAVTCVQFDDQYIASGSCDRTIRIWGVSSGLLLRTLTGHQAAVHTLQFGDGKIVSGSGNESMKIWDFKSGECLHTLEEHDSHVVCLQFDHQKIVSGSGNAAIKIINFGDPYAEYGKVAACLPLVRKRRAKSLSGSYTVSVTVAS